MIKRFWGGWKMSVFAILFFSLYLTPTECFLAGVYQGNSRGVYREGPHVSRKAVVSQAGKGSSWAGDKADDPEKTRLVELNKEFYEAMNTGDFHSISSLWLQDDYVQFYWGDSEEVTGYGNVMKTFKELLVTDEEHGRVLVSDVRATIRGLSAWVTCKGVIDGNKEEGPVKFMATTMFRKFNGEWKITHHHSGRSGIKEPETNNVGGLEPIGIIQTPEGQKIIMTGGSLAAGGDGNELKIFGMKDGKNMEEAKELIISALMEEVDKESKKGKGGLLARTQPRREDSLSSKSSIASKDSDDMSKKTLVAIRELCLEGRITVQQKRKLIYSVIHSASLNESSQVEMAYDLLVENALAGEENKMDEFADQCRIIAETTFELEE